MVDSGGAGKEINKDKGHFVVPEIKKSSEVGSTFSGL